MISFNECDVIVNGTGLIADSASISEENSSQGFLSLGFHSLKSIPNGAVVCNVQIDYRPNIRFEPNLSIIDNLKRNPPILDIINLEIGGLQTCGFLKSYSLSSSPNETSKVSASYICYSPVSGSIAQKRETVEYNNSPEDLIHGWSTLVNYSQTGWAATYDFNYNIEIDYLPMFSIGSKTPNQIVLVGGSERMSFIKEDYFKIDFSGLGASSIGSSVSLYGLNKEYNNTAPGLSISLNDGFVKSSSMKASLNDFSKTNISIERVF